MFAKYLSADGCFAKNPAVFKRWCNCYANHVPRIIDQHFSEKSKQTTIRYYFPIRNY